MVTALYFFNTPTKSLPLAIWSMAVDRGRLRRFKGVSFAKLLGAGKGETFTPRDADIHRWGFLVVIDENQLTNLDQSRIVRKWRRFSTNEYRVLLDPISSHGKWSKREPFEIKENIKADGKIAAITRARIKASHTSRFFASVPPVTASLHGSSGLLTAIGIGEAPIGLQGTFSLWNSAGDLRTFAYKGEAHTKAIADTEKYQWYAEELFARFSVREERGSMVDKRSN
jgi:hypothetical protein